jgi:hypothetical protein
VGGGRGAQAGFLQWRWFDYSFPPPHTPLLILPLHAHTLHTRAHTSTRARLSHHTQPSHRTGLLPGVFVNYELSPLRVRISERRRSLGHFLTNCCAIIGGVLTVAGLLDSLLYRLNQVSGSRKGELAR